MEDNIWFYISSALFISWAYYIIKNYFKNKGE